MHRRLAVVLIAVVVAGCAPTATTRPSGSPGPAAGPSGPGASVATGLGAGLPPCSSNPDWRCGTVRVPVDRQDAASAMIDIHYYVLPHGDASQAALEPVIVSPGGPGASIWANFEFVPIDAWQARHDTVLIDPRGVGESGRINCPALDAQPRTFAAQVAALEACATSLDGVADRYGSADAAQDIDAVRAALGVATFDYVAASYATMTAQAYAVRYPEHLHALVLDSAFQASGSIDSYYWGTPYPGAFLRILGLRCSRAAECASTYPDPRGLMTRLIHAVASAPITDHSLPAPLGTTVVDEAAIATLLGIAGDQPSASDLLAAATAALDGHDPHALLQLVADAEAPGGSDPSFSAGDNAAASCADGEQPWAPADPPAVREQKLKAAIAALPADTFAPFTVRGWIGDGNGLRMCEDWPRPHRIDPVIPSGASYPDTPTLVLAGDVDVSAPLEIGQLVAKAFPHATFEVIAGAGHDASAPYYGACGGMLIDTFLDTLQAPPDRCPTPGL